MNKRAVEKVASVYNAVVDNEEYRVIQCVAPIGYYWIDSDSYHIAVTYGYGSNKSEAYDECIDRMQCGIRPIKECERDECEYYGPLMPECIL